MKNKMIMMIFSLMLNILFLNFNNPLIMSLILIFQTIILNMIMGKIYYTFWFSYIMFLIFIGGLFILFIYIISLIYNNMIFMKKNNLLIIISIMMLMIFSINLLTMNKNFFMNFDSMKMNNELLKENYLNMIKFFNFPNNIINLMMISYLFLLMIIVVKITNFMKGPIKSFN